jgi:hypothetical protein
VQQQPLPRTIVRQQQQQQQFNQQVSTAVNAALTAYQQAELRRQAAGPAAPFYHAAGAASVNAMSAQTQAALPPFPGLDGRGLSWHISSPLLECRCSPCTGKFCQACGVHGHTVENCRKRLFRNSEANMSGYWCEQQPGRGPMRAPASMQRTPAFTQNPGSANFATTTQQPPNFPTPYRIASGGRCAQHASTQQPEQQSATPAVVNNTAQRDAGRSTFQDQQPAPADVAARRGEQQQQ